MSKQINIYYIERAISIIAAVILLQTLYFKFTAAPVSVHIFSTLGIEPWGRIGSGVVELVSGILLFMPKTSLYGAILALGTMAGAIMAHLFFLGIEVQNDGGSLFLLAIIVTVCSLGLIFIKWNEVLNLSSKFIKL
ncbi:MAG TPA: DoxX family protein [Saprospiraceae bacterium]|nr:DoxX family protein [Saprospiraceae bacterium]